MRTSLRDRKNWTSSKKRLKEVKRDITDRKPGRNLARKKKQKHSPHVRAMVKKNWEEWYAKTESNRRRSNCRGGRMQDSESKEG